MLEPGSRDSDLKSDLDADVIKDLRNTICEFEVAIIPDQNLSPEDQVTFSHLLGPYSPVPFVKPIEENSEVIKVVKESTEPEAFNFGGVWHSDFSFSSHPTCIYNSLRYRCASCGR